MVFREVSVRVPATAANLGPGFDCLGMALEIFNVVTLKPSDHLEIVVSGHGEGQIPLDEENLVYRAVEALHRRLDNPVPPLRIECQNGIPLARGLGSSAAAVVGGLVAANALWGFPASLEQLLPLGVLLEGHPDNVTPALLGGCRVVVQDQDKVVQAEVPLPPELRAVLFIPDFAMPTMESRRLLPDPVSRADAVYNLGRTALLVAALAQGKLELLPVAMGDRLHQPAREQLFPAMGRLFAAALSAGALGACLSGGGSAVLAFAVERAEAVAQAMSQEAAKAGISGQSLVVAPCPHGAQVTTCE